MHMGSKGKSGYTGLTPAVMGGMVKKEKITAGAPADEPQGVAAKEDYRAPDPWRKRTLMDELSPQTTNAGRTLLG